MTAHAANTNEMVESAALQADCVRVLWQASRLAAHCVNSGFFRAGSGAEQAARELAEQAAELADALTTEGTE